MMLGNVAGLFIYVWFPTAPNGYMIANPRCLSPRRFTLTLYVATTVLNVIYIHLMWKSPPELCAAAHGDRRRLELGICLEPPPPSSCCSRSSCSRSNSSSIRTGPRPDGLPEFRAFPLFFYGQNYSFGCRRGSPCPRRIGGPTRRRCGVPLVALNLSVALDLCGSSRQAPPPLRAGCRAPVIAFTPVKAIEFASAMAPASSRVLLRALPRLLRKRPVAFGMLLGFGTLHREFTFLALPALATAVWPDRRSDVGVDRGVGRWLRGRLARHRCVKRNINKWAPPAARLRLDRSRSARRSS
jgi:hypothetical protein